MAITGIVIATAWCVKLEMTTSALKADMEIQKAKRDESIQQLRDRINNDHDLNIAEAKDIEWMKQLISELRRSK